MKVRVVNAKRNMMFLCVSFLFLISTAEAESPAEKLYVSAQQKTIAQNWDGAIDLLQQLIDDFPESKYHDDALFNLGYCMEHKGDHFLQSFFKYQKLINQFPESPWLDDARIHRIYVSKILVEQGNKNYIDVLLDELESDNSEIVYNAALSLGELGDQRALAYLKKLRNNAVYGNHATVLYESLLIDSVEVKEKESQIINSISFNAVQRQRHQKLQEKQNNWGFIFKPSENYKAYRRMLKETNQWSMDELIDFGMWTVLSEGKFREFYSFTGYDRREWFRRYWKGKDPTPTSPENEALEEFKRRVLHSRAKYGQHWDAKHFKYLTDQYNRTGWPNAPWDARGELFIKYGEPDFVAPTDFNEEEWVYHRLGVDFIVKKYMTNIYGNAISPGELSLARFHDDVFRFELNYEYVKEFIFNYKYNAVPLKNTDVEIRSTKDDGVPVITIEYKLPSKELSRSDHNHMVAIDEKWVVFDEHLQPLQEAEQIVEYNINKNNEIRNYIEIFGRSGDFTIALRLKDVNSDKLGIFVKKLEIDN